MGHADSLIGQPSRKRKSLSEVCLIISFSDSQLQSVLAATRQVAYADRTRYLALIATELEQCGDEIGDGAVHRAVANAIRFIRRNPAPS